MELSRNNANDIPPLGILALPPGTQQREASVPALRRFVFDKTGHLVLISMSYSLVNRQNDITQGLKILEIIAGED